ncbi:MAG: YHS domain-containing (seleno)protein [Alphaproteobacteria bacterium]|nr:YHS domain-containing (seleno)protein [Alphaproteobacteria bacterium]
MMRRLLGLLIIPFLSFAVIGAAPAAAEKPPVYTGFLSNLAVGGYDPVAYFKEKRPVKGSADYTLNHKGVTWRFASRENLEAFRADPGAYAPQYGGYCAWAVSQGYTAKGDPMYWRIVGGKLYLNYDGSVQARWEKDIPGFIAKADANWPKVLAN